MRQAFDYYLGAGDEQLAIDIAAYPIPPVWGKTQVPALLARGLEMAEPDSLEAGRILANIGRFAGTNDGNFEAAQDAFERSLAIAQRYGDSTLERRVLALAARVDWWFMRWQECTEKSLLALELALAAGDQQSELYARAWLTRDAAIGGDLTTARAQAASALELAERLRERYWLATARLNAFGSRPWRETGKPREASATPALRPNLATAATWPSALFLSTSSATKQPATRSWSGCARQCTRSARKRRSSTRQPRLPSHSQAD